MTRQPDEGQPPLTRQMQSFEWDSEESVAYEAAVEAINEAVGAYTARIAAEEAKPVPDAARITAAEVGQAECARRREKLDPADHAQIGAARREFSDLARQIRADVG
jgi:hypothetical protein